MTEADPAPRTCRRAFAPRPCWCAAAATRSAYEETSRGAVPDLGLCLRQRRRGRGRVQAGRLALRLFALPQPDRDDVRGAAAADRRRRGLPRHRERHGGGVRGAAVQGCAPGSGSWRAARCSARATTSSPICCRATASRPCWSTAATSSAWEAALRRRRGAGVLREPVEPGDGDHRPRRGGAADASRRRHPRRRQCVRDAAAAEAAGARRRCRRLFGDQAHRRPGPRARRRDPGQREIHQGRSRPVLPPHRPVAEPVQRLAAAEGAGDAGTAGRAAMPHRRGDRALSRNPSEDRRASIYPGLPSHPQYELAQPPDEAGRHASSRSTSPATRKAASAFSTRCGWSTSRTISAIRRASSPIRRRRRIRGSSPRSAPRSASATGWCASRPGSKPRPICLPTCPGRWKRSSITVAPCGSYLTGLCWLELGYGGVCGSDFGFLWSAVSREGKARMQPLFKHLSAAEFGVCVH